MKMKIETVKPSVWGKKPGLGLKRGAREQFFRESVAIDAGETDPLLGYRWNRSFRNLPWLWSVKSTRSTVFSSQDFNKINNFDANFRDVIDQVRFLVLLISALSPLGRDRTLGPCPAELRLLQSPAAVTELSVKHQQK